jgi:hypothetical protein
VDRKVHPIFLPVLNKKAALHSEGGFFIFNFTETEELFAKLIGQAAFRQRFPLLLKLKQFGLEMQVQA